MIRTVLTGEMVDEKISECNVSIVTLKKQHHAAWRDRLWNRKFTLRYPNSKTYITKSVLDETTAEPV